MKRFSGNRRIAGVAAAGLAVTLAGILMGSTSSFFTDQDAKANTFTTGDLDITLREPEWDPKKDEDGKNLYPGCTLYKNPTIKNVTDEKKGAEPCYARMTIQILDNAGKEITDTKTLDLVYQTIYYDKNFRSNGQTGEESSAGLIQGREPGYCLAELSDYPMVNPLWKKDEQRSKAACLVYNYQGTNGRGILETGEESTLFTTIVIPTDWGNEQIQRLRDFRLSVTVQAIQAVGFANMEEAQEAMDQLSGGINEEVL